MPDIRIGTSGWSYPDGPGTWNGIFYPGPGQRGRGDRRFDELRYYAEHFNTVEVNSTFYRLPTVETVRRWAERTPPPFDFSIKLFQKFTHPALFLKGEQAGGAAAPGPIPTISPADIDDVRRCLEPLASAGKLGPVLAQFPPSYKRSPEADDYLASLLAAFRDYPLAVELRHRSWSDTLPWTLSLLAEFDAALVQIDEPKFRFSIRQNPMLANTSAFYYMRLHGRNAAQWWRHDHADERYNYLYSPQELRPFTETAKTIGAIVKKMYLYLNNHFAAKSVANAAVLRHELGQPVPGEYRHEMLERYPFLRPIVKVEQKPAELFDTDTDKAKG